MLTNFDKPCKIKENVTKTERKGGHIMSDASKVRGRMTELKISYRDMAKMLNMSPTTLTSRLKNKGAFSVDEILSICKILGIPSEKIKEYFFD